MNESIGNRIAKLRKENRMSQENLAEKLGVSAQAVSKWENGQSCPDISLLPQLANLLGVSVDELLTGKTDEVKLLPESQRKPLEELTLRIKILSAAGDKMRVNLPIPLVKIGLELGMLEISGRNTDALKNLDLNKILALVEQGAIGKLVEVESAQGDLIEVVVE